MASNNFVTFLGALNVGSSPKIGGGPRPSPFGGTGASSHAGEASVVAANTTAAISPVRSNTGATGPAAPTVDVEAVGKQVLSLLSENRLTAEALASALNLQIEQLEPVLNYLLASHMIDTQEGQEVSSYGLTEFASEALQVFNMA